MLLSILIPTIHSRQKMLYGLLSELHNQIDKTGVNNEVEILVELDGGEISVGNKRQLLLQKSKGIFLVYADDDDEISSDYIHEIINAISHDPDVISFNGYMTHSGERRENFKIMKDLPYITVQDAHGSNLYLRFNNHLSPIKREIAIQIGYKDLRFGEDFDYAKRLKESGLVKTEYYINKDLYHYKYIKVK